MSSSLTNLLSVSENALHKSYQQFWLLGETNLWEALTGHRKEGRRNFRTFICSVGHLPQPENQTFFQAAFSVQLPLSFYLVVFSHKVVSKSCMTPQTVPVRGIFQARVPEGFPSPAYLPNPAIKPGFPALQADFFTTESLGKFPFFLFHSTNCGSPGPLGCRDDQNLLLLLTIYSTIFLVFPHL